jgi:hypothetical protein
MKGEGWGHTSFDELYVATRQLPYLIGSEGRGLTEVLTNGGYPYKASYTIISHRVQGSER